MPNTLVPAASEAMLAANPNLSRRRFLGGVAITAIPSAVVAAEAGTSHSQLMTAAERANFHWQQFAVAMDEMTEGFAGWYVQGGHRRAFLHLKESEWSNRKAVEYRVDNDPRFSRPFVSEHHVRAALGGTGDE